MAENSVTIEGRVVGFPKVHFTSTNNKVVTFTISYRRMYRVRDEDHFEMSYFLVEAWGPEADYSEGLVRGDFIKVFGRIKQDRWTSSEGEELARVKIMAEHIKVIHSAGAYPERKEEVDPAES